MSRRAASLLPLLLIGAGEDVPPAAHGLEPQQAPREYMTGMYGLTFVVPAGATYCPLPDGWIGSDHGTTIFLERPRSCGGSGYPSSSRGFEPGEVARISLYYGYWMGEDEPPPPPCKAVGTVRFLGQVRPVCETLEHGLVIRSVTARYMADIEAEAVLTLVTRPARLTADMSLLAALASSTRTCTATHRAEGHSPFTVGTGAPCPEPAVWF